MSPAKKRRYGKDTPHGQTGKRWCI